METNPKKLGLEKACWQGLYLHKRDCKIRNPKMEEDSMTKDLLNEHRHMILENNVNDLIERVIEEREGCRGNVPDHLFNKVSAQGIFVR